MKQWALQKQTGIDRVVEYAELRNNIANKYKRNNTQMDIILLVVETCALLKSPDILKIITKAKGTTHGVLILTMPIFHYCFMGLV